MVVSRESQNSVKTCIDLQKIIEDYAWKKYTSSIGKAKSILTKRANFGFDFQWNFLDFTHLTHVTDVKPEDELFNSSDFGTPSKPSGLKRSNRWNKRQSPQCFYKKVPMDFDDPVVMDTVHVKNTTPSSHVQTFSSLAVESTVSVELTQSYSLGGATNIQVKMPTDSDSDKHYTVTNCNAQDFQDVAILNFNQKVLIEPGQRVEVVFLAREKTEKFEFEVTTVLSMVIGCLPVAIKRKSDGKTVFTSFITSLREVFDRHVCSNLSVDKTKTGDCKVSIKSRGKCRFTKWIEPEVMAQSEPIVPEL